jgi:abnormal spindle-like microcephaly-associated protein
LQSPDVANILQKLEIEIEKYRFDMRKDKAIHKDVGMKKKFLQLILNYNPLWLRIGLETVFGRIIPMNGAADYVSLSKFIIRDFLYNPDVLAQFAHPTVPHHYADGHDIKLKQFILKKFFNLILFLDQAKKFRLIKHNPCLFCKDSPIKMSKDIITSFSRDFLSGEGDVMKHLGYLGYKVYHKQTHLDEFDFAVTNIAVDLRCGIRLCRVMEILTKNQGITDNLRMPAQTRMQKLHNVGIGLKALESSSAGPLPEKTTSKDMVDGHLQKTLDVLWHLIFGFQIGQLLNPDRLSKEIQYLEKTLNHEVRVGNEKAKVGWNFYLDSKRRQLKESSNKNDNLGWLQNEKIALLLKWARVVCAHYGVEIENLSVSFSDGRGLCLLVHHYHPSFLTLKEICMETTQTQEGNSNVANNGEGSFNDSFGMTMTYSYAKTSDYAGAFEKLLKNEKENFKLLHNKTKELGGIPILIKSDEMSNTIPDQKVTATFMTYMAARLLDLSTEMQAARIIQFAWKRFLAARREQELKVRYK